MLHHDQGVAQIAQVLQGADQPLIISLVQANRRLIQNVQHARQAGTNLRSQADALSLTAG